MKLCRVRTLFTKLLRCPAHTTPVRLYSDCLSANEIAEFFPYFSQYTIIQKYLIHILLCPLIYIIILTGNNLSKKNSLIAKFSRNGLPKPAKYPPKASVLMGSFLLLNTSVVRYRQHYIMTP